MNEVVPHVVYHVATMGNWREVIREQFAMLAESGLAEAVRSVGDQINITHVGHHLDDVLAEAGRHGVPVRVIRSDPNTDHYETFAMIEIDRIAKIEQTRRPILYMHTKGVSCPNDHIKAQWRRVMGYQVVSKWRENVRIVSDGDKYDAAGFNWWSRGEQHFSGTFWVARADWIRRLPEYVGYHHAKRLIRYSCELWIGAAQYCRAYSHGVQDVVTWTGDFDFTPYLPPPAAAVQKTDKSDFASNHRITWVSCATPGYAADLNQLAASFPTLANGPDGDRHELIARVVSNRGTWRHCRKLDVLKATLPIVDTSHVFWIDADCEFVDGIPVSYLIENGKPLSAVQHFLFSDPKTVLPGRIHGRLPSATAGLYWQACVWGGEVAAVRDVIDRVSWITTDERGYDEHALNIEFQHRRDSVYTLACRFAKPGDFRPMPPHAAEMYESRSGGPPKIVHWNREIQGLNGVK